MLAAIREMGHLRYIIHVKVHKKEKGSTSVPRSHLQKIWEARLINFIATSFSALRDWNELA